MTALTSIIYNSTLYLSQFLKHWWCHSSRNIVFLGIAAGQSLIFLKFLCTFYGFLAMKKREETNLLSGFYPCFRVSIVDSLLYCFCQYWYVPEMRSHCHLAFEREEGKTRYRHGTKVCKKSDSPQNNFFCYSLHSHTISSLSVSLFVV